MRRIKYDMGTSHAFHRLTYVCQYDINIFNLKIETTIDDNYSDDELTFLPYYTYLSNAMDPVKACLLMTQEFICQLFEARQRDAVDGAHVELHPGGEERPVECHLCGDGRTRLCAE